MTRSILISFAVAAALSVAAQDKSRLSTDIIDTYTEMIAASPSNCDLYLSRATEYASQGLLSAALIDLNDAMRLAPKGEKGLMFEILTQRAAILERQHDFEGALADLDAAAKLYPDVPSLTLSRARVLTGIARYSEARETYNSYRRLNPRSSEAIFGLAKASALEADSDMALRYMNEGIDAAPKAGDSYLAAAEIHLILRRKDEAVTDYIKALACGDNAAASALQKLVDMSAEGYPDVMKGLDKAITAAPTSGELYFLRASIAQDHDHHRQALADFNRIDGTGPFAGGALGEAMAESLFALGRCDDALNQLDRVPEPLRGDSWHTLRARILINLGRHDDALAETVEALMIQPSSIAAMEAKARALMGAGRDADAAATLSEALITDPSSTPELYYLATSIAPDRRRSMLMEEAAELPFDPADPASLKGFALIALGRTDEAVAWASALNRFATAGDGVAQFISACIYARVGKTDEALRSLETAIKAGFDNCQLILTDTTPGISIAPLREHRRFREITASL